MNKINKKTIILIILIIVLCKSRSIAGYIEKINIRVTAQIAKSILDINYDEKISGNYLDVNKIPEYFFEIKNYNDQNIVSQIESYIKLEAISKNKLEFEIIDCDTNKVILDNKIKSNEIIIEKDKKVLKKYKVIVKDGLLVAKDKLEVIVKPKHYNTQKIEIFDINFDKRNLEVQVFISNQDKKYVNNDCVVKIECNKEVKPVEGFELLENKTCLTKIYPTNSKEEIVIEDYFGNQEKIKVLINNIDKISPEILGIEDGKTYEEKVKLIYTDNIGIKNIRVENITKKQKYDTSFDTENKVIDNQILVTDSNNISPYYLNQLGNYIISAEDFAGNKTVKHICIK